MVRLIIRIYVKYHTIKGSSINNIIIQKETPRNKQLGEVIVGNDCSASYNQGEDITVVRDSGM